MNHERLLISFALFFTFLIIGEQYFEIVFDSLGVDTVEVVDLDENEEDEEGEREFLINQNVSGLRTTSASCLFSQTIVTYMTMEFYLEVPCPPPDFNS